MDRFEILRFALNRGINHVFHEWGLVEQKPWNIVINPTLSCNLRCKQCDFWRFKESSQELSLKEWRGIINDLREWLGCYCLNISGGEPLLKKETSLELIRFASEKNILTILFTNGWLLSKNTINRLEASGLYILKISADGYRSATHDFLRGRKGLRNRIFSAVDYIKENRIKIRTGLNFTIMEPNLDEIPDLMEWAISSNTFIMFQALSDNPGRKKHDTHWFKKSELWPKDTERAIESINGIISFKQRGYPVSNSLRQLDAFKMYYSNPTAAYNGIPCSADKNIIILHNGDMKICPRMGAVGNLKGNNPKSLWKSAESERIRGYIRDCNKPCKINNCNFRYGLGHYFQQFCSLRK